MDFQTKEKRMRGMDEFDESFWQFRKGEKVMLFTFIIGLVILGGFAVYLGGISY